MAETTVTYTEVRHLMIQGLRATHPEWKEEVLEGYDLRIVTLFKLLEIRQNPSSNTASGYCCPF